jgi:hypothetical protein
MVERNVQAAGNIVHQHLMNQASHDSHHVEKEVKTPPTVQRHAIVETFSNAKMQRG